MDFPLPHPASHPKQQRRGAGSGRAYHDCRRQQVMAKSPSFCAMRFSLKRRVFSILSGAWLVLLLAEPRALQVCAVHADGMSHAAGAHDGGRAARMPSHEKAPGHDHSSKCTCLGASSYTNAIAIPSVEETVFADAPVATATQLPTTADVPPPSSTPFFLPYPNGPPVVIAS
jgi:hypothetical protein